MKATKDADGFATFLGAFEEPQAPPPAGGEPAGDAVGKVLEALKPGPRSIPVLIEQSSVDVVNVVESLNKLMQVGLVQRIGQGDAQQFELTSIGQQLDSPGR